MTTLQPLIAWWRGLAPREKLLLRILGALATVVILVFGIVKPLQAARAEALSEIRTYETLVTRLKSAGPNLRPQAPRRAGSPQEIASASAASFGLPLQSTAASGAGVAIALNAAPFDTVLRWIADVEASSDLRVRDLDLAAGPAPGLISGQLVLAP